MIAYEHVMLPVYENKYIEMSEDFFGKRHVEIVETTVLHLG